jgi:hypothetical protein
MIELRLMHILAKVRLNRWHVTEALEAAVHETMDDSNNNDEEA